MLKIFQDFQSGYLDLLLKLQVLSHMKLGIVVHRHVDGIRHRGVDTTTIEVSENPETEDSCSTDIDIPSLKTDKQSTAAPVPQTNPPSHPFVSQPHSSTRIRKPPDRYSK